MALLHRAELHPTKLELLAAWLPSRSWYQGPAGAEIERVAACRFDDPAGAVGIETILVRAASGPIHHVPLTYRDAPMDGGDAWLEQLTPLLFGAVGGLPRHRPALAPRPSTTSVV